MTNITNLVTHYRQEHSKLFKSAALNMEDNTTHFIMKTSDGVSTYFNEACLYYLRQTLQTQEPVVVVGIYGQPHQAEDERLNDAIRLWVELFKPLVENAATVLDDQCVVVDTSKNNIDSIGAFLVGLRNLREGAKATKNSFLQFVEEGFSLAQAAALSQLFCYDKKDWSWGYTGHNIIVNSFWHDCDLSSFVENVNSNLFDQTKMLVVVEYARPWSMSPHFFSTTNRKYTRESMKSLMLLCGVAKEVSGPFGTTIIKFNGDKLIQFLKEHLL